MKATLGEILFATVLSSIAAAFATVLSLIGVIFLWGWLSATGIWVVGVYGAVGILLMMPLGVFIAVFRKVLQYGEPDSLPSSK